METSYESLVVAVRPADGEPALVARCSEPMTKAEGRDPPHFGTLMRLLVALAPDARGEQVRAEPYEHPADFGDELLEWAFPVSTAAIKVLRASHLHFEAEAERIAAPLEPPEAEVEALRRRALEAAEREAGFGEHPRITRAPDARS